MRALSNSAGRQEEDLRAMVESPSSAKYQLVILGCVARKMPGLPTDIRRGEENSAQAKRSDDDEERSRRKKATRCVARTALY